MSTFFVATNQIIGIASRIEEQNKYINVKNRWINMKWKNSGNSSVEMFALHALWHYLGSRRSGHTNPSSQGPSQAGLWQLTITGPITFCQLHHHLTGHLSDLLSVHTCVWIYLTESRIDVKTAIRLFFTPRELLVCFFVK